MSVSTPRPSSPRDLTLAPTLLAIEMNLDAVRRSGTSTSVGLAISLGDRRIQYHDEQERTTRVVEAATRGVNLHYWKVQPTDDHHGLEVTNGEHKVTLALGAALVRYIEEGPEADELES